MELTKGQIAEIEEYLKLNGIKYWDIRIEMIDHIATYIEEDMEIGRSFEGSKTIALQKLNWNGSLKDIVFQRLQFINKKVRSQYFRNFFTLFSHFTSLSLIVLIAIFLFLLYNKIDYGVAKNISLTIYYVPSLVAIGFLFGTFILKKSAYLQYGSFYMIFSFTILNTVLLIARNGSFSEETSKWLYVSVAIVNALAIYAGINTYLSIKKQVKKMQKELKLL